jgi:hypothetical protein
MKKIAIAMMMSLMMVAGAGWAAAPQLVPIQGMLTDTDDVPIDGEVSAVFSIYTSEVGGSAFWTEIQRVRVTRGFFTAYMGDINVLDLVTFRDYGDLWLGIQIESDPEMQRVMLGTNPFAAYAEYCGSIDPTLLPGEVPVGPQSCTGTQKVSGIDASGNVVCTDDEGEDYTAGTGLTLSGTTFAADVTYLQRRVIGTCATGSAISAVAVDGSVTCSTAGIPTGAVMFFDLTSCPSGWSELTTARGRVAVGRPSGGTLRGTVGTAMGNLANPSHTHTVNPSSTLTSSAGSHNHRWSYLNTAEAWYTYTSSGSTYAMENFYDGFPATDADDTSGYNYIPVADDVVAVAGGNEITTTRYYYTDNETSHTHTVDIPSTTSSSASHVMPYIQLLICRKD